MLIAALVINLIGALVLAVWMSFCFRVRDGHIWVKPGRLTWMSKWFPNVGVLFLVIGFILQLIAVLKE